MGETYRMLLVRYKNFRLNKETSQHDLKVLFDNGNENEVICHFFLVNYGMICSIKENYSYVEEQDFDSAALLAIQRAFETWDEEQGIKLTSYFGIVLRSNYLKEAQIKQKISIKSNYGDLVRLNQFSYGDSNDRAFEIPVPGLQRDVILKACTEKLTPSEKEFVHIVLESGYGNVSCADIADMLGMTRQGTHQIKLSLRKKINLEDLLK